MARYFAKLSYKGTKYHGWQVQPNANSVQAEVDKALTTIFRETINCTGCGRTDTGVHAMEFYAHFDCASLTEYSDQVYKVNAVLPPDIAIQEITEVNEEAHARFDAVERKYIYRLSTVKDPFAQESAWQFTRPLDLDAMNNAASLLLGKKDFASFCKAGSDVKTTICDVKETKWERVENMLLFTISADRFLRNMVRAIVGTLVEVGLDTMSVDQIPIVLRTGDRSEAGASVPAHGLYLAGVTYPEGLLKGEHS